MSVAGIWLRLSMQTREEDARALLELARHRGAAPEDLREAWDLWRDMREEDVREVDCQ